MPAFRFSLADVPWVLMLVYVTGVLAIGEPFYELRLGLVFVSEMVMAAALVFHLIVATRATNIRLPLAWLGFWLWAFLFFVSSLVAERPLIWVLRHFALCAYVAAAFIGSAFIARRRQWLMDRRWGVLVLMILAGIYSLAAAPGIPFSFVGRQTQAPGILLLCSSAAFLTAFSRQSKLALIGVLALALTSVLLKSHASYPVAILVSGGLPLIRRMRTSTRNLLVSAWSGCGLAVALTLPAFRDANATWRFKFWTNVLDGLSDKFWIVGEGFGVPYLHRDAAFASEIIAQVSSSENVIFQLMAVPPHNGLITVTHHLGLMGLILLYGPVVGRLRDAWYASGNSAGALALFSAFLGTSILMLTNQFLEVPYSAIPYWFLFGAMWETARRIKRTAPFEAPLGEER